MSTAAWAGAMRALAADFRAAATPPARWTRCVVLVDPRDRLRVSELSVGATGVDEGGYVEYEPRVPTKAEAAAWLLDPDGLTSELEAVDAAPLLFGRTALAGVLAKAMPQVIVLAFGSARALERGHVVRALDLLGNAPASIKDSPDRPPLPSLTERVEVGSVGEVGDDERRAFVESSQRLADQQYTTTATGVVFRRPIRATRPDDEGWWIRFVHALAGRRPIGLPIPIARYKWLNGAKLRLDDDTYLPPNTKGLTVGTGLRAFMSGDASRDALHATSSWYSELGGRSGSPRVDDFTASSLTCDWLAAYAEECEREAAAKVIAGKSPSIASPARAKRKPPGRPATHDADSDAKLLEQYETAKAAGETTGIKAYARARGLNYSDFENTVKRARSKRDRTRSAKRHE